MKTLELTIDQPFDLGASLESGQAHRWKKVDGWYSGVVRGEFIQIRQKGELVEFSSGPSPETTAAAMLRDYFRFDDDINAIYSDINRDNRVAEMVNKYPGLRILRTEPWECLVAFICSANNNIARIHQLMERMSDEFGARLTHNGQTRHTFPTPADLAEAGEGELRRLGLGFRAPYVDLAARAVLEGELDLPALVEMPYLDAKAALMERRGIGSKIADCIAVFSLEKLEAFPIDVWIRRALGEWYFPGQKTPPDRVLLEWAMDHFGRYGGYAQQYLFHGQRLRDKKTAE
ncbi:MAG: 8-oxoguanine DNA glycosylase [Chloroflexi bacterium]|nr:8-oxoguanine DNA glycosylase [Chloroflexota bacterium]